MSFRLLISILIVFCNKVADSKNAYGIAAPTCVYNSSGSLDPSSLLKITPANRNILICARGLRIFYSEETGAPTACCRSKYATSPPVSPTSAPASVTTQALTDAPTQALTDVPTQTASDAPTEALTDTPTQALTEAPTQAAADTPTQTIPTSASSIAQNSTIVDSKGLNSTSLNATLSDSVAANLTVANPASSNATDTSSTNTGNSTTAAVTCPTCLGGGFAGFVVDWALMGAMDMWGPVTGECPKGYKMHQLDSLWGKRCCCNWY